MTNEPNARTACPRRQGPSVEEEIKASVRALLVGAHVGLVQQDSERAREIGTAAAVIRFTREAEIAILALERRAFIVNMAAQHTNDDGRISTEFCLACAGDAHRYLEHAGESITKNLKTYVTLTLAAAEYAAKPSEAAQ